MTDQTAAEPDEVPKAATDKLRSLTSQLEGVVLGQQDAISELLLGLLADGHVLLEGVPGVGKTLLARALAKSLALTFRRVQFTPDLMPADLLGTRVFDAEARRWETHRGPLFTELLLADEINRTPPKTQAALLEAMEERQITLDGERHELPATFFVVATENPLEFEGTYPLPEAQTDRFLLKVALGYPGREAERALLGREGQRTAHIIDELPSVMDGAELRELQAQARAVTVSDEVRDYALRILEATRQSAALKLGASPRSGLMLLAAARARALLDGRTYTVPDDVKRVCAPVLRHRLVLSTEAELDGLATDAVLDQLVGAIEVRGAPPA